MANVTFLTFNPFQENTYIVYDETGEAVIFDPGCSNDQEKNELLHTLIN
jgi:glyoxylase-like metal-dependent hydrolase (beta-lactamase superfamily II)